MASVTIVVTQNTDNSLTVKSTDAASWVVQVPNETMQIKRVLWGIKDILEANLSIT